MGLEAECSVRVGRKASTGLALLEGEVLLFRGDWNLKIPFEEMRDVKVDGAVLVIKTADSEALFELGAPVAERWVRLIKEPKSLFEKLEVGPTSRVAVVDVADSLFLTALRERTAGVAEGRVPEGAPIVFFGAETRDALRKIQLLRARMIDTGVLWVVRPKGSQAITEADVFAVVRQNGLVDTKVVAFSKTHTAHRCVIPVEMRGKPIRMRPPVMTIPPSAPLLRPRKAGAKPSARAPLHKAKAAPPRRAAAPVAKKPAMKKAPAKRPTKNRGKAKPKAKSKK